MNEFATTIERWYNEHKRDLPWRETTDPYQIWISEIILQQTRVAQGYAYFLRFMERFPTVKSLAEAPEDEVMRLWQGLGYYSRARNLHEAARMIASREDGFPKTYEEVRALKGIGEYTAAAICSFAYGLPYAAVDGNVYRVLSRWLGIDTPIDTATGKSCFPNGRTSCLIHSIQDCTIRQSWILEHCNACLSLQIVVLVLWKYPVWHGRKDA